MSFIAPLAASALGYFGQQQANSQTTSAQQQAQQNAQNYSTTQNTAARNANQQGLLQAMQALQQYQKQNPSPISQLGAIQQAPQTGQASFGGGVQGSAPPMPGGAPQGGMQQQNLRGAMQQPQPGQGPPQGGVMRPGGAMNGAPAPAAPPDASRIQQLYPMVQQMIQGQRTPQPMARAGGS